MNTLKVGDTVLYKQAFGTGPTIKTKVESIEVTNGGKYGDNVDEIPWSKVTGRNVVVDLDCGNWGYGNQISRI
jgi:hypothetical protein